MYKVISFDIGGTLIKEEQNPNAFKYDLKALSSLVNLPYEEVRTVYKDVYQKTNGTFTELLNLFCDKLNIPVNEKLTKFFQEKFTLSINNNTISKEDIKLIKDLKENGYKVIFVSNSCSLFNNQIDNEIKSLLDGLYYSYQEGYTKSDKELYDLIEADLKVEGKNILHIGDTLRSDYQDPIKYGWNALYYGVPKDGETKYITDLKELYNILNINNK